MKDCIVEFRAGRMNQDANSKTVRADVRKGKVQLKRSSDDGIVHFLWIVRHWGDNFPCWFGFLTLCLYRTAPMAMLRQI
jgi:hypothetical protein